MIRLVWYTFIVLATLTILVLLWQFNMAIILFFLSIATAAAFRPAIHRVEVLGISHGKSLLLVYGTFLILSGLITWMVTPQLLDEVTQLSNQGSKAYESIMQTWPDSGSIFQQKLAEQLPPPNDLYSALAGERGSQITQAVLGEALNAFDFLGKLVIVLVMSLYWNLDAIRFERLWLSLIPVESRWRVRTVWREIEGGVGAYLRNEMIQSLLAGLALGLGYQLIGLPYPLILALLAVLANLIPILGRAVAILPGALVGWVVSPWLGGMALVYTITILWVLGVIVEPHLSPNRNYSSLVTVLVILVLGNAFGLLGIILAPPLSAAIQILARQLVLAPTIVETTELQDRVINLRQRLFELQQQLEQTEQEPQPNISSLAQRLDNLVAAADQYLNQALPKSS